jgi:hypothetical protein
MAHRRWYVHGEFWFKNVEVRDRAADLGADGSVISKLLYSEDGRS